jgi:hypothetical protein
MIRLRGGPLVTGERHSAGPGDAEHRRPDFPPPARMTVTELSDGMPVVLHGMSERGPADARQWHG